MLNGKDAKEAEDKLVASGMARLIAVRTLAIAGCGSVYLADAVPRGVTTITTQPPDADTVRLALFALALAKRLQRRDDPSIAAQIAMENANYNFLVLPNVIGIKGVNVRPAEGQQGSGDPFQPKQFIPGVTEDQ